MRHLSVTYVSYIGLIKASNSSEAVNLKSSCMGDDLIVFILYLESVIIDFQKIFKLLFCGFDIIKHGGLTFFGIQRMNNTNNDKHVVGYPYF